MNHTQAIEKIKEFVKSKTGLDLQFNNEFDAINWNKAETIDIEPSQCGAAAPMFQEMTLDVSIGYFDFTDNNGGKKGYKVVLKYSYMHFAGSNGHTVQFITTDDCATFKQC